MGWGAALGGGAGQERGVGMKREGRGQIGMGQEAVRNQLSVELHDSGRSQPCHVSPAHTPGVPQHRHTHESPRLSSGPSNAGCLPTPSFPHAAPSAQNAFSCPPRPSMTSLPVALNSSDTFLGHFPDPLPFQPGLSEVPVFLCGTLYYWSSKCLFA